jgi:hypothetical protein
MVLVRYAIAVTHPTIGTYICLHVPYYSLLITYYLIYERSTS